MWKRTTWLPLIIRAEDVKHPQNPFSLFLVLRACCWKKKQQQTKQTLCEGGGVYAIVSSSDRLMVWCLANSGWKKGAGKGFHRQDETGWTLKLKFELTRENSAKGLNYPTMVLGLAGDCSYWRESTLATAHSHHEPRRKSDFFFT